MLNKVLPSAGLSRIRFAIYFIALVSVTAPRSHALNGEANLFCGQL
jgi:hypothetical protein